ncbi:MAG: class I SAM-dependent methyltransferase [Gammaproteobacteria bacterium]
MNKQVQEVDHHFVENYWREEGGRKWVENIERIEFSLIPLSEKLLERAHPDEGEMVLDVGCGGGVTSLELAQRVGANGQVLGVDIAPLILAIALERGKHTGNLEFKEGDVENIDIGEGVYDLICSRFGVMFFNDPVTAFANLHRALKSTGRLVFICWRTVEENPWMGEPASAVFEILPPEEDAGAGGTDPEAPGPFSLADPVRLRHILESAGFREVHAKAVDTGMPLGRMDEAVNFVMRMGPAAEVINRAGAEEKTAAARAIQAVLSQYETADGVIPPCAAWLVTAKH